MSSKVLFVDDDAFILEAVQRTLRKHFTLDTASDGATALDLIESQGPYAVVVSDLQMPRMNGYQLLEQVEQRAPDTVRVMMTGDVRAPDALEALKQGRVFCFLAKPCAPMPLIETIEAGLRRYRIVTLGREMLKNAEAFK